MTKFRPSQQDLLTKHRQAMTCLNSTVKLGQYINISQLIESNYIPLVTQVCHSSSTKTVCPVLQRCPSIPSHHSNLASSLFQSRDKGNVAVSKDERSDTGQNTNQTELLRRSFIDDNRAGCRIRRSRDRNRRNRAWNNRRNGGSINGRRNNNSSR